MKQDLSTYYRVPDDLLGASIAEDRNGDSGFFRFGPAGICFGHYPSGRVAEDPAALLYDASEDVRVEADKTHFLFDPSEVIDNLRKERYVATPSSGPDGVLSHPLIRKAYYVVRELLPVSIRRYLQRAYFNGWRELEFPQWPVDFTVDSLHEEFLRLSMVSKGIDRIPFIWFWPEGARAGLVMTHDVETRAGRNFTHDLMDLDDAYGLKSSFQLVPENRYDIPDDYVRELRERGFEFNIHDLNHDGFLFREHEEFLRRAAKINAYVRKYRARGFRSGAMYRNQAWYDTFDFSYDMSVPSVAHLEPQRGGCCTVMPYFVGKILELPLTATQDYTLFHILNDYSLDLWKNQLALIGKKHGLMSFIAHPDYLIARRARKVYEALLDHLRCMITQQNVWAALPGEVDRWWRTRNQMKLVKRGNAWEIVGEGRERARVAYAQLENGGIRYTLEGKHSNCAADVNRG